jgi:predicted phage terminase large subunit-like protein
VDCFFARAINLILTEEELEAIAKYGHLLSKDEQEQLSHALEVVSLDEEIELLRSSFLFFVKEAWAHVEDTPMKMNWHVELIAAYVQALEEGKLFKDLIVNVPPGAGKSTIISVCYPAWAWTRDPKLKFFTAAYSQKLSTRDTRKCRKLITSDWYQKRFGTTVTIKDDAPCPAVEIGDIDQSAYFNLKSGGWRMASTPGGAATGEHPSRIIIDDANNAKKAESEPERDSVNDWWDLTMSTRGAGLDRRRLGVQQRFHVNDWTGHVLKHDEDKDWAHVCIPMRYERDRMKDIGIGTDPRTEEGQLMWPELYTEKTVKSLERQLGIYGTAGQLQQRPTSREGALFKIDEIQIIPADAVPMQRIARFKRFWDKAGTKGAGDESVGAMGGIVLGERHKLFVMDMACGRWSTDEVEKQMDLWAKLDQRRFGQPKFETVFEQEPGASGVQAAAETVRRLRRYRIRAVRATVSKVVAAEPLANAIAAGEVYFVEGPWVNATIEQMRYFPKGDHDDRVDAIRGLYMELIHGSIGDGSIDEETPPLRRCKNPLCNRTASAETDYCCDSCIQAENREQRLGDHQHCPECAYRHGQLYATGEWDPSDNAGVFDP